jgi:hypothetical protein
MPMAEEHSNRQQTREDLSSDLRRTGYVFIPLAALGVIALVFKAGSTAVAVTYLMWALSCLISGSAIGFLFGIPKILQNVNPDDAAQASSSYRQQVNTNLEQISDWLTKIIVGLGLINLTKLPPYLAGMAAVLAAGTGDGENKAFAMALIVYFALLGFLSGYLSTRLFLAGAFSKADQLAAARSEGRARGAEQTINQLRSLAKDIDPGLFKQLVTEIRPEEFVDAAPDGAGEPAGGEATAQVDEAEAGQANAVQSEREALYDILERMNRGGR